jgi:RNA polymerase subunit RPABC4/transcription elongation factor Spt4
MIQCRECNNTVSDSARVCPNCGIESPGGSCELVILRPSLSGGAIGMTVYVDNTPYGDIRSRKSITIPVAAGQHHIHVETSRGKTGTTTVDVTPQSPTKVNVGVSQLTGGVKFS